MTENLATALAALQAELPTVAKSKKANVRTKDGGNYSYTYADLADVTEAALPLLSKHGLSFTTRPQQGDHGLELVGSLLHTSGEREEGSLPIRGNSPQELGSSLTYMRRYLLGCLTGLVTDDDDDGNLAQRAAKAEPQQQTRRMSRKPAEPKPAPESPMLDTKGGLARKMFGLFNELGITEREQRLRYVSDVVGRPVTGSEQMTDRDAREVCNALIRDAENAKPDHLPDPADGDDPWAAKS